MSEFFCYINTLARNGKNPESMGKSTSMSLFYLLNPYTCSRSLFSAFGDITLCCTSISRIFCAALLSLSLFLSCPMIHSLMLLFMFCLGEFVLLLLPCTVTWLALRPSPCDIMSVIFLKVNGFYFCVRRGSWRPEVSPSSSGGTGVNCGCLKKSKSVGNS